MINKNQRKSIFAMGLIILFMLGMSYSSASSGWNTVKSTLIDDSKVVYSHTDASTSLFGNPADAGINTNDPLTMYTYAYNARGAALAQVIYETDYTTTSNRPYRAQFDYKLFGSIDHSKHGNLYSYLEVRVTLSDDNGNVVGTGTNTFYSGNFDGTNTYTITTSSDLVESGVLLHAKISIFLYAEGSLDEPTIINSFSGGSNHIEPGY